MKTTIHVKGMHCASCVMLVREALEDAGAKNVTITLEKTAQQGTVTLETNMNKREIARIVEEQGDYRVA